MKNQNTLFEENETPEVNFSEIAPASFKVEITETPEDLQEDEQGPQVQAPEEPKRGRGRPPKETGVFNVPSFSSQEPQPQEVNRPKGETVGTTLAGMFPSGGLIMILDKAMSNLVPIALNNLANMNLKPKDFVLTSDEIETISPLLDKAAETIPINLGNPWANLAVVLMGTYTAKAVGVINFAPEDRPVIVGKSKGRGRPRKNG